jgi:hypothetical protein
VRVSAKNAKGSAWVLVIVAAGWVATGCETGRTNKIHSPALGLSDETTTGKPDRNYVANGEGIPPVPGSPTAAGPDGKQPFDASLAKSSPGAEHGMAAPPAEQDKDRFIRQ